MLSYVPVVFDAYRSIRPHLRWTLQNLVAFADRAGRCFPSVRKLASITGASKSSVARHLRALERDKILTRHRSLVVLSPTRSPANTCRLQGCPTNETGVSHGRQQKKIP